MPRSFRSACALASLAVVLLALVTGCGTTERTTRSTGALALDVRLADAPVGALAAGATAASLEADSIVVWVFEPLGQERMPAVSVPPLARRSFALAPGARSAALALEVPPRPHYRVVVGLWGTRTYATASARTGQGLQFLGWTDATDAQVTAGPVALVIGDVVPQPTVQRDLQGADVVSWRNAPGGGPRWFVASSHATQAIETTLDTMRFDPQSAGFGGPYRVASGLADVLPTELVGAGLVSAYSAPGTVPLDVNQGMYGRWVGTYVDQVAQGGGSIEVTFGPGRGIELFVDGVRSKASVLLQRDPSVMFVGTDDVQYFWVRGERTGDEMSGTFGILADSTGSGRGSWTAFRNRQIRPAGVRP
ncbi:MAG: hypothetical protein ACKOC6_09305 [bacterium]